MDSPGKTASDSGSAGGPMKVDFQSVTANYRMVNYPRNSLLFKQSFLAFATEKGSGVSPFFWGRMQQARWEAVDVFRVA